MNGFQFVGYETCYIELQLVKSSRKAAAELNMTSFYNSYLANYISSGICHDVFMSTIVFSARWCATMLVSICPSICL